MRQARAHTVFEMRRVAALQGFAVLCQAGSASILSTATEPAPGLLT